MNKILSVLFLACFIAAEGRLPFPIEFNTNDEAVEPEPKPEPKPEPEINYRLPLDVIPKNYNIKITTHLDKTDEKEKFSFHGEVYIKLSVLKDVDRIVLHSDNPAQLTAVLIDPDVDLLAPEYEEKTNFTILKSKQGPITTGDYTLRLTYKGKLYDDMRGFYRSSYTNEIGEKVWLAATHFEPVGARRAFPCFDEPGIKATFDLTIIHAKGTTAISNMKSDPKRSGETTTVFETTPAMSTYLLAFAVSNFRSVTNKAENFTVYARPDAFNDGILARDVGQKLLQKLEEFTGVPFSKHKMTKMDQIALPDFAAGAMENWGLVTYKEKSLLFNEKVSTTSEKQNVIETIAHEFAHQWFGDLVSPKWWDFLWLNEGFANFFQSLITEQVEPKFQSVHQSVVKSIQTTAFDLDSTNSTHPINAKVSSPKEISGIFDGISYQKAGAVIRMMQHFLTTGIFKEGLKLYLEENSFKAADSDILFDALTKAAKKQKLEIDVKTVMNEWVNKKGYPLVTVVRNYEEKTFEIKQERYVTYKDDNNKTEKYQWHIPINYVTAASPDFENKTTPDFWFKDETYKPDAKIEPFDWLILNKQQTGFYRVNYDVDNWNRIIDYLKTEDKDKIHVLNRAQLINDALSFAKQEILSIQTLMQLTYHLRNESSYIPWYPGFKTFTWMKSKLINTERYPFFKQYVLNSTKHLIESVKLAESKDEDYVTKLNRITAINWVCSMGDKTCMSEMQNKLGAWLKDGTKNEISPDLKQVTLCHGLRSADFNLWKSALDKCEKSTGDERKQLISALACSEDPQILRFYMNYTLIAKSKLNDVVTVVNAVRDSSDVGIDAALDFLIERFISIYRKLNSESKTNPDDTLRTLFHGVGTKITTAGQLEKLKASEKKDIDIIITSKAINAAQQNIEWLTKHDEVLTAWKKEVEDEHNGVGFISASFGLMASLLMIIFATAN